MLGMTSLELAEPEPAVEDRPVAWGVRQSLVLLGAAIILGALVLGIYFLSTRPAMPLQRTSPEQIRRNSQSLTALQSWRIWLAMRANGLDRRQPPEDKAYEEQYVRWWLKMGVVLLIAVVGAGLVVVPLATRKTRPADPLPQDAESGPP
jgi:heme A synthase